MRTLAPNSLLQFTNNLTAVRTVKKHAVLIRDIKEIRETVDRDPPAATHRTRTTIEMKDGTRYGAIEEIEILVARANTPA